MTRVSHSHFRQRIERHFASLDLDVVCRKKKQVYAIYWADDGAPLARLRPTGQDDEVEVFWWNGDRWRRVTDFGLVLPLDEALEYVTDDPDDVFFEDDVADGVGQHSDEYGQPPPRLAEMLRLLHRHIFPWAVFGGAAGGLCPGPWGALACGAGAGIVFSTGVSALRGFRLRGLLLHALVVGIPVALVAGAAGTMGGSVNEALAGGVWGSLCGLAIGGLSSFLMFGAPWLAWLIGFSAGLTLAARLVSVLQLREHWVGLALAALVAAGAGKLYSAMARRYLGVMGPILRSSEES